MKHIIIQIHWKVGDTFRIILRKQLLPIFLGLKCRTLSLILKRASEETNLNGRKPKRMHTVIEFKILKILGHFSH